MSDYSFNNQQILKRMKQINNKTTSQLEDMTLEEKIGQLLIGGYEAVDDIIPLLKDGRLGGVILFKRNIQNAGQTRTDIEKLKIAVSPHLPPIFVSVDQEGGRVSRLPDELGPFPSARQLAAANDLDDAGAQLLYMAMTLKQLGFNLNYAPVLDIDSNPDNPVIGDRSFGKTPQVVIAYAAQVIRSMRQAGIIPVGKHFPGHGDTSVDSHVDWPIIDKCLDELERFELLPFKAAVDQKIEMLMAAHVVIKSLTSHPASLSREIITDLLRDKMGYEGVIITDDLTMGAVTEHYELSEAVVMALEAGCDLLPVCHGIDRQLLAFDAILNAVKNNRLTVRRINSSVRRILSLKNSWLSSADN